MITVFDPDGSVYCEHAGAVAAEVMDNGALLLFKNTDGTAIDAAYAPGAWMMFHMGAARG